MVWFVSLFEKNGGENTGGEKQQGKRPIGENTYRGKDLAGKRLEGKTPGGEKLARKRQAGKRRSTTYTFQKKIYIKFKNNFCLYINNAVIAINEVSFYTLRNACLI